MCNAVKAEIRRLQRSGVPSDRRRIGQGVGAAASRVNPAGRDLGQRTHDEQPFRGARMRQDKPFQITAQTAIGDQIEVQRPRRIPAIAAASEHLLDPPQRGHQGVRIQFGADDHDAVQEGRIARVGPGRRPPPGRPRHDVDPLGSEPCQGGLQRLGAIAPDPLVIAAEGDDDGVIIRDAVASIFAFAGLTHDPT